MAQTSKSGSKPERTALRQRLLEAGASADDVATEMRSRWGFRPREAYRHAHGWSQDEVAVRFNGIAGRLGSGDRGPATMIGTRIGEYERWPHGGRRPSAYVLTVLAEVYGTALDRLMDTADLVGMPEQDRAVLAALADGRAERPRRFAVDPGPVPARPAAPEPSPVAAPVKAAELQLPSARQVTWTSREAIVPVLPEDETTARSRDVRRAVTLARTARDADAAELLAAASVEAAEFSAWAEAVRVGPSTLEQLEQDVRVVAHDYLSHSPLPLLRRVLALRNRAFGLLERRQRPAHARDLYLLAGRLCAVAAWTAGDLGFPAEAVTHARTGWLCAELAGSPGLHGWLRVTQSKLAYWKGRPADSAELAEDGLRYGVVDSGRAALAALAARGWSRCGQTGKARRALRLAETELEGQSSPDEVGGILGFSEAQQHYLAGTAYLWMNEPRRALESADRAVWLFGLADVRDRFYAAEALAQCDSAIAQLQLGQIEGAADRLSTLLDLPPAKRMAIITSRVDDLERMLRRSKPVHQSTATRLADELAEFRHAG